MATEKKTKTVSPSSVKEPVAEPKKATPAPKKPAAEKPAAAKKPATKKTATKKPAVKAAAKKVEETLVLQAVGGEWNVADVKERVIADYVAAGHTRASIKALTVYIKPEERTAYYVINEKAGGSVAI